MGQGPEIVSTVDRTSLWPSSVAYVGHCVATS